jgi:hypothetical protein
MGIITHSLDGELIAVLNLRLPIQPVAANAGVGVDTAIAPQRVRSRCGLSAELKRGLAEFSEPPPQRTPDM